jgi:hypothetical protein
MMRSAHFASLVLYVAALVLMPQAAAANIRLMGDWTWSYSESDTTRLETDEKTQSENRRFRQLYRADLSRQVYPTLLVNGGVLFERSDLNSEVDGEDNDTTGELLRPYVDVELGNDLYTLAGGYRESETTRSGTGLETSKQFVEEYDARAEWQPVGLPGIEATYTRTLRNSDPETTDQESNIYRTTVDYAYRNYEFLYNYMRSDDEQKTEDTRTLTQTHNGRVRYSRGFFDNRLTLNARVQAERSTVEFSGTGERIRETIPSGSGIFLIDDPSRDDLSLDDPELLMPSEFTSVNELGESFNKVNYGGGGGTSPASVGLEFSEPVNTDRIRVEFERLTSTENQNTQEEVIREEIDRIEQAWKWEVYFSDGRMSNWKRATFLSADYDPTENYFEIKFNEVTDAEYIMVTTKPVTTFPLEPGRPLPKMTVSNVRAFFALAPDDDDEIVSISRNLNFGVGWKMTDKTRVGYDLAYQDQEVDAFDIESRQMSNIFNISHIISQVFSASARFLRNDRWRNGDHDSKSHQFTAQMSARWLETLGQSLTYSGERVDEDEGRSTSHAVFLRTNAELYRGWDVAFDQGYTWQDQAEQGEMESFFVRVANSIVPHRRLNFIVDYSVRWTRQEERDNRQDQTGRVRAFWTPTDTLSLNGEYKIRDTDLETFSEWEFGAGWLPLRDGTLQLNLRYSEEGDTDDERLRSFSPSLTWALARNTDLTLTYTLGRNKDRVEEVDYQSFQANLRFYYD